MSAVEGFLENTVEVDGERVLIPADTTDPAALAKFIEAIALPGLKKSFEYADNEDFEIEVDWSEPPYKHALRHALTGTLYDNVEPHAWETMQNYIDSGPADYYINESVDHVRSVIDDLIDEHPHLDGIDTDMIRDVVQDLAYSGLAGEAPSYDLVIKNPGQFNILFEDRDYDDLVGLFELMRLCDIHHSSLFHYDGFSDRDLKSINHYLVNRSTPMDFMPNLKGSKEFAHITSNIIDSEVGLCATLSYADLCVINDAVIKNESCTLEFIDPVIFIHSFTNGCGDLLNLSGVRRIDINALKNPRYKSHGDGAWGYGIQDTYGYPDSVVSIKVGAQPSHGDVEPTAEARYACEMVKAMLSENADWMAEANHRFAMELGAIPEMLGGIKVGEATLLDYVLLARNPESAMQMMKNLRDIGAFYENQHNMAQTPDIGDVLVDWAYFDDAEIMSLGLDVGLENVLLRKAPSEDEARRLHAAIALYKNQAVIANQAEKPNRKRRLL